MKKITVTGEKIFRVYKAFDRNNSNAYLGTSHSQVSKKGCQYREEDSKIKFCHKKSTLPVKRSR